MKEVDYKHMDDVMMFHDVPFDPVTKKNQAKPSRMTCKVDDRYDTGLIICKDENEGSSIWKVAIAAVIFIVVVVFSFSVEIEVKHLEELPLVVFLLTYPQAIIGIIAIVVTIILLVRRHR